MIKVFTKIFLVIFFLLISFIGYLSLVGLETKRFNNQIKQSLKKIDSKIDIKLYNSFKTSILNFYFSKGLINKIKDGKSVKTDIIASNIAIPVKIPK